MEACTNRPSLVERREDRHDMNWFQADGSRHFGSMQGLGIDRCHCCDCKNLCCSGRQSSSWVVVEVGDMNRVAVVHRRQ